MRRIGASCFCELSPRTAWNVRVIAARLATLRGEGIVLHSAWRALPISGPLPPPYPAPGAVACVDRRLAEAEFRPYIRAGPMIVNIAILVSATTAFESDEIDAWFPPLLSP
jgi:hypothetical protein